MKQLQLQILAAISLSATVHAETAWVVDTQDEWEQAKGGTKHIEIAEGQASSTEAISHFSSAVQRYENKRAVKTITFKQTTAWDNWREVPNVGPERASNALVFLPVKAGDYWLMGRHQDYQSRRQKGTRDWLPSKLPSTHENKGYHAWHSTDMKTWTHRGPVTTKDGEWMTTAEYADGKYFLYYDNPNDQDPHLVVDDDLGDGVPGKSHGMVLNDPSNGSDCAVLRDEDGVFHIIFEDWTYNNARKHAWDAPVAGHAVSPDGIQPFTILDRPAVDERTTPTGEFGEYKHSSSPAPLKYEIHEPEQNAYGDWTAIKVGGQYYLFCDYDPVGEKIRVGRFTSESLDAKFSWCGEFGGGHPDPSVGFAEGQFYLIQQQGKVDFVSPGPWVDGVEARVGVDTSGNGQIDQWADWQEVREHYDHKPGFARIVNATSAQMNLASLPEGYGFSFEYRTTTFPNQAVHVVMEKVEMSF